MTAGVPFGDALEALSRFRARTMHGPKSDPERDAIRIARQNTQAMKRLGILMRGGG